jgi:protein-tyrosine-phosphatase
MRVLFLCTGNTCRSPLAAALAKRVFADTGVRFESAGLQAVPGQPASPGSQAVARANGADLGGHLSRPLSRELLAQVDWVIGMTRTQVALFKRQFGRDYSGKIGLLGLPAADFARHRTRPGEEVGDPYGGAPDAYAAMGRQVARLLAAWAEVWQAGSEGEGGQS